MEITVDEWIVHFISDSQKRKDSLRFLEKLFQKCDKLVAVKGGSLMQKIWQMAKESGNWDPDGRKLAKYFLGVFLNNSNKFLILDESNLKPLPLELAQETPSDDFDLVRAAINTTDKTSF